MKTALAGCVALLLASSTAFAVDLSGAWTTRMTFASGAITPATTFTLHLAGAGWQLTTTWDPSLPQQSSHALLLQGSLGPLGFTAGASVRLNSSQKFAPLAGRDLAGWSVDGFEFRRGFVSFKLALGNLSLRLTLHTGLSE